MGMLNAMHPGSFSAVRRYRGSQSFRDGSYDHPGYLSPDACQRGECQGGIIRFEKPFGVAMDALHACRTPTTLLRHAAERSRSVSSTTNGHHIAFMDDYFGEQRFGESTVGHVRSRASNRNEQWIAHILADQSDKFRHRSYARQ